MDLKNLESRWINDEINDIFSPIFSYPIEPMTPQVTTQVSDHVNQMDINAKILKYCKQERSLKEI